MYAVLTKLNKRFPIVILNYDDGNQVRADRYGLRQYDNNGKLTASTPHDDMSLAAYNFYCEGNQYV